MGISPDNNSSQNNPPESTLPPARAGRWDRLALLPVPVLLLLIATLWLLDLRTSFEQPLLLMVLNMTFSTVISLAIAYLVGRSFLQWHNPGLLLLGCGVLAWGAAGATGALAGLIKPGDGTFDANTLVTVHNICIWLSAFCHLSGAAMALRWNDSLQAPRLWLGLAYLGILIVAALIVQAALSDYFPEFFVPGHGGTLLRQFVLGSAVAMFVLTAILLHLINHLSGLAFVRWYSLAVLLLAIGLIGVWSQKVNGSPVGWAGRLTQYLGSIYMLMVAVRSAREPYRKVISEEKLFAATQQFRPSMAIAITIAVASTFSAGAFRLLFLQNLGQTIPYVTFFPAVILAAVFGGLWSGIAASILSTLLVILFWTDQIGHATIHPEAITGMVIFFGNGIIISLIASAMRHSQQRVIRAESEARYAAEREQASKMLLASEARYKTLVLTAPVVIAEIDDRGLIQFQNRSLVGTAPSALIGTSKYEYIMEEDRQIFREALARVFESRQRQHLVVRMLRENRKMGWWVIVLGPVVVADTVKSVVLIANDITEQKEMEEQVNRLMREQNLILQTVPVGIIKTVDRRLAWVNRKIEEMFEYPKEELISGTTQNLFHSPEAYKQFIRDAYRLLAEGEVFAAEQWMFRKNGTPILVKCVGEAIDFADITKGIIWTIEDITQRKQAEAEQAKFATQYQQLQKSESLRRMAGAIAHHYNNLLGAVIGNLEMAIDDTAGSPGVSEILAHAMKATKRAAELSHQMLVYLGQSNSQPGPLDLAEICRTSVAEITAALPGQTSLHTVLPHPGPTVTANASQLEQVVKNLVTNASEAIGNKAGSIHLTVTTIPAGKIPASCRFPADWQPRDSLYGELQVRDTGCGIAKESLEKLFDPFFTTKFTGRGLGLPVVLGIVQSQGGAIAVASETGQGSTFRVFLPITTSQ
ncbi:MAG: PAS domain S-box protein [Desulforhopalus sp.]|nr:PAS domain S-box protein [Desulforhopalus sp.]